MKKRSLVSAREVATQTRLQDGEGTTRVFSSELPKLRQRRQMQCRDRGSTKRRALADSCLLLGNLSARLFERPGTRYSVASRRPEKRTSKRSVHDIQKFERHRLADSVTSWRNW